MRDLYVSNGHGFVLVYSITSQATFNEVERYYERIIAIKDVDKDVIDENLIDDSGKKLFNVFRDYHR